MDEEKKPDLVVWDKDRGYYASQLTYGSNLGAPAIKLEDVTGWRRDQALQANSHFKSRYEELAKELEELVEEVNWNTIIYTAQYNFIPVVGYTYHLYKNKNASLFLSIIEPTSWNMDHVGSFRLDSEKKWIKI